MKKSIWIFLFAVLLPGFVLGWLALRSAEEQQIIFERRTAELYQKETEGLAASAREVVENERRAFGDTVHRLLARSDAEALARDFTNSLMDAWPRKAVGFVLGPDGEMLSPTTSMAAKNGDLRDFLWNNGSFLCSTQPAVVYPVPIENNSKAVSYAQVKSRSAIAPEGRPALSVANGPNPTVLAQKGAGQLRQQQAESTRFVKTPIPAADASKKSSEDAFSAPTDRVKRMTAPQKVEELPANLVEEPSPEAPAPVSAATARSAATKELTPSDSKDTNLPALAPARAPAPAAAPEVPPTPAPQVQAPAVLLNRGMAERGTPSGGGSGASAPPAPKIGLPLPSAIPPPRSGSVAEQKIVRLQNAPAPAQAVSNNPAPAASASAPLISDPKEKADRGRLASDPQTAARPEAPAEASDKLSELAGTLGRKGVESGASVTENIESRARSVSPAMDLAAGGQQIASATPANEAETEVAIQTDPAQQTNIYSRLGQDALNRMVEPQQQLRSAASNWSAILPATADFRALTAGNDEGMLARFVQDKLDLVFWIRPPEAPEMVFGCLIEAGDLDPLWKDVFASRVEEAADERPPFVLALLNDKARPVATFPAVDTGRDWKRPFVANEIGEVLPHWEAALYLATPTAMADTARGFRRTLSFTIAGAIALIAIGGWLVVHDVRRQLALAQQKTDFVSNVSHELKTPLTSIRMFAELMHDRPPAPEKQGQYLRIIRVEAERLTRLINNVLDFAKLERRQRRFEKRPLDLCSVITRVWEGHEMHLRDAGFTTRWQAAPGPYPVLGDEDALAQILVNLLSNAEKYSQDHKDVELVTWLEDEWVNASILDRGIGVPEGEERKIFEAFYRAHDSLSSGIQGSGLGLTLAQRVAREHGGEIVFDRRQDGGSRFTLRLPRVADHAEDEPARGSHASGSPAA